MTASMPANVLLRLNDVTIRRPDGIILQHLDWTVGAGERWAILGATGSGKTSLLDALTGQLPVWHGQLTYSGVARDGLERVANDYRFDRNVALSAQFYQQRFNADAAQLAPTVWEVLQQQVAPPGTVDRQSVALPPLPYTDDWLASVAEQTQITPLLNRPLTSLSNGETRRVLLARSLLRQPRLLLLDNPFGGLDADSRSRLHHILNRISADGTALILVTTPRELPDCITHVLHLADRQADWQGPKTDWMTTTDGVAASLIDPVRLARWQAAPTPFFERAVFMEGVTVRYGDKTVLDTINWTVRRGEKWAILGPNGSGKSTLLSLITGDHPQSYQNHYALFDRKRGTGESIWDIKRNIGFVSPELHLYFARDQSVWNVVASGLFDTAGLFRRLTPEQTAQTEFMLDLLGIGSLRTKRLYQLSTGEQRWVLLGRALVKNPPLLVLDEPCQNLDPAHISRFRDLIDTLCEGSDRTLLYVTHYAEEIPRCVTHVLRLTEGRGHVEQI